MSFKFQNKDELLLSASLAERVDARPSSVFHWPSGSHTIDALEIQSGSVWAGF